MHLGLGTRDDITDSDPSLALKPVISISSQLNCRVQSLMLLDWKNESEWSKLDKPKLVGGRLT